MHKAKTAFLLSGAFVVVYFAAAVLKSEPMKATAGIDVIGLPLAIWAGMVVFLFGLLIARLSVMKL